MIFPDFSLLNKIEQFCRIHQLDYIDGITSYCEKNNVEIEIVAELIKKDPVFTAKMQIEAEKLNFVKKSQGAKLPI
ncbi:MAG: late promoter transcription accessory protein [Candidatus Bathyarchaeia archaeon]